MKRLNVLYYFPTGDQDHPTTFFPFIKRSVKNFKRHHQAQQISLLPVYHPDNENQQ
jgi:hypothetical protein